MVAAIVVGVVAVLAIVLVGAGVVAYVLLDDPDPETATTTPASDGPDEEGGPRGGGGSDEPTDPPTSQAPTPKEVLERNALYDVGRVGAGTCRDQSTVALDGLDGVRTYYESVLACLDTTWSAALSGSGVRFRKPGLTVFSGPSSSPCGDGLTYAFYCPSNRTIYMYADEIVQPWQQYPTDYSHGITRLAAAHTIAHEYGHHLQQLSGIFDAAYGTLGRGEAERRTELQASCLGNVFLGARRLVYPVEPYWDQQPLWRFITILPNHGSEANQQLWTDRGYQGADPGDCNTFTAPASEVT